ncbi:MAG: site-2 protease family protein [Clostridia bacterium]|nr:site-2 protease family protein [Clostridia bacterium]
MVDYILSRLFSILITLPAVLLVIIIHECAHGYVAYRLGDPTAKHMGRLTLNPLRHLDPIGTLCMVFFHFGWAKPVPVNPSYFRDPKKGMALTALAGPMVNILTAFLTVPLYMLVEHANYLHYDAAFLAAFLRVLSLFFYYLHAVSIGLALFNLIPIPPLDGSQILFALLPARQYNALMRYRRYFPFAFLLFLIASYRFGILSSISGFVSLGMERIWSLIPYFR